MTGPDGDKPNRGAWWLALPAVIVVCCAGPAVFASLGAGSVGVLVGGATGSAAVAGDGLLVVLVACVVVVRRRKTRR